jgi:hypothetical protein
MQASIYGHTIQYLRHLDSLQDAIFGVAYQFHGWFALAPSSRQV